MKKIMIVLIAVIAVFALSCSSEKPKEQPVDSSPVWGNDNQVQEESSEKVLENPAVDSVPSEIKTLLSLSSKRVSSASYFYKGPENENEVYGFFVKGNRIKYIPPRQLKSLDAQDAYDSIFLNTKEKTAVKYCDDITCKFRGKKDDLSYDAAYIMTPFDWVEGITLAEKIGEEKIENRNTIKISTNKGMIWVDSYYGVAFRAESNGKSYKYSQIAFNKVEDSQVVPFDAQ